LCTVQVGNNKNDYNKGGRKAHSKKEEFEMKKYRVTFVEKVYHEVYVEANNEEEAEDVAIEAFGNGESEINDSYVDDFIIEEEK
jgi:hypothetical protein